MYAGFVGKRLKILATLAAVSALALFAQQVHQSDPPAVFKATAKPSIGHCYRLPSPVGSESFFCDVRSPATGRDYVVVITNVGGIDVNR